MIASHSWSAVIPPHPKGALLDWDQGLYLSSFSKCHFSLKCWEFMKFTPTFNFNFLKLKIPLTLPVTPLLSQLLSLLPETAEEVWNEPQNPQIILHLHCGEHPDRLHHRLVWKQHRWQPQGSAKGRANCPPHCWRWASLPPGHLHQAVYKESPEDYQRLQPPVPQTALSVALRETSPQHPILH